DLVAPLRHPLDLVDRGERLDTEAEEDDPETLADGQDLAHVLEQLAVCTVDALALLAAQLELTAGLDGDVGLTAIERDNAAAVELRRPTVLFRESLQNALDSLGAAERRRCAAVATHADLLVLRSDPPFRARLRAAANVGTE